MQASAKPALHARLTNKAAPSRYAFGPRVHASRNCVEFKLWAPSAQSVALVLPTSRELPASQNDSPRLPMQRQSGGWYTLEVPNTGHGTLYQFQIDDHWLVPDPASRYQPADVHGPSQVIDFTNLPRLHSEWKNRPWEEAVVYELHVGTFTPKGTFQGVIEKLDYLKNLGITAIELMPIAEFPGQRNWGYDGVLPYAPDSAYGTPSDLKALINEAHCRGLMIILDVVYNHFGPDGNYLHTYAQPFFTDKYQTPWGAAIHFEGPPEVRQFFIENALFWLKEYGFDGLRLDAVHAIQDSSPHPFLEALSDSVQETLPRPIHLILENDDNRSRLLETGYQAQWNDDFHHAAHVIATGETGGYYQDYDTAGSGRSAIAHLGRCLAEGFAYQGEPSAYRRHETRGENSSHLPPTAFVNFLQNHDQIGNRAFGERLAQLAPPAARLALLECLLLAPAPPLLFMGEEWGTEQPFLYFCDFEGDLAQQVREGRRQEFARFPAFADPALREGIPDPNDLQTFQNSCLNWSETEQEPHLFWLKHYTRLLTLRQERLVPRLPDFRKGAPTPHGYEVFETCGLQVRWALSGGQCWQLTANLGSRTLTVPPNIFHNLVTAGLDCVYHSEANAASVLETGQMPAWFVIWQTG
ncbi:malto-oligosyltrehalose trehalohydrolase [Vampirovibrio chlorellavorus]|uniref:malto-oligosyltrehalose trehalohydrolase n=1 Tax=Vampirovibrio chlorellavorus TaxID=758823 RepID=UPI003FCE3488